MNREKEKKFADTGVVEDIPQLKYNDDEEVKGMKIPGTEIKMSANVTSGESDKRD